MNELFSASFLGIVQGLTEFLPISSSGHLIVLPEIFGWEGVVDSLSFDVALHLGTLSALLFFFWKDWIKLFAGFSKTLLRDRKNLLKDEHSKLLILLLIGSIPAGVVGLSFKDFIESNFRNTLLVGITLIVFGFLLWYVDRRSRTEKKVANIGLLDSLIIGAGQALSLIPGVSRSGITITAARSRGIDRESAVRFSFLLSTPAILGAGLITSKDLASEGLSNPGVFLIGFIAAAVSGLLAIKLLIYVAKRQNFDWFVYYRYVFGVFLILFSLFS